MEGKRDSGKWFYLYPFVYNLGVPNSHNISNFSITIVFSVIICDQWSLMSLSQLEIFCIFSSRYVYWWFFRCSSSAHLIDHNNSVNITFICTRKQKDCVTCFIAIFTLLRWSETEHVISSRYAYIHNGSTREEKKKEGEKYLEK